MTHVVTGRAAATSRLISPMPNGNLSDRLTWYASVARLAPSKHNTQPWSFVVREGSSLEFWNDASRALSVTDGRGRERVIAIGAAVHFACVAARAHGFEPHVELLPEGSGELVARLTEAWPREVSGDDGGLFAAVGTRHTDRGPLDATPLPLSVPFLLQCAATENGATLRFVRSRGERATLASLVARADRLLASRGDLDRELHPWLREEGDPRLDGVPVESTRGAAASYRAEFVQRDFSLGSSVPGQDRSGDDLPHVGVIWTKGDRAADWFVAGRGLAAVLLRATTFGANASFLNQPLEEPSLRSELRDDLELPGYGQVILRIGVGAAVTPTLRRSVAELVTHQGSPDVLS